MDVPANTNSETLVRQWTTRNEKENSRLEYKLRVLLDGPAVKAEFVRDVIALANSDGEFPREHGYFVIGFKEGQFNDVRAEGYDGATFGQILDAYISPLLGTLYEEFENGEGGRIGVLTVMADPDSLYIVRKPLSQNHRMLLTPGQSWGRRATRKIDLDGDAIRARLAAIMGRAVEGARNPLLQRIEHLEQESGASLEVKRIRFAIEDARESASIASLVQQLSPYAYEFEHHVKQEVLYAVSCVTTRIWEGMGIEVVEAVNAVIGQSMPLGSSHHARPKPVTADEAELIRTIGNVTFEMTWNVCRYLRNTAMAAVCARRYWILIRFVAINDLDGLQKSIVHDALRCRDICAEAKRGVTFLEGGKLLDETIKDALNLSQTSK